MGSTLHQATRSKELVNMFHQAGHVMSYYDIIKLDTSLTKNTPETMNEDSAVLPPNLVPGRFVYFYTDNLVSIKMLLDINESTLGKVHFMLLK
jgi:hypothetical protein